MAPAMRILKSGAVYFALVFGAGFVLGIIRTLLVVPRLGIRTSELLESPFLFVAIVWSAGWISRRIGNFGGSGARVAIGMLALVLALAAEVAVGVALRGLSLIEVFTHHDPVSGSVYYLMLGVFAVMPWLLWVMGKRKSTA